MFNLFKIISKSIFLLILLNTCLFAYNITNILAINQGDNKRVRVVVGGFLAVENIILYKDKSIKLPHYKSKGDYETKEVDILDPELKKSLLESVLENKETGDLDIDENKISVVITPLEIIKANSSRKANVRVVFDEKIAVVCSVIQGKRGPWVAWPARKDSDGKYHKDVYLLKERFKKKVEEMILNEYNRLIRS